MTRWRGARGFTLVELVVVLVIAGLMVALVPPLISRGATSSALKTAARDLAAALRFARGQAITRHREAVVTLDTERRRYTITGKAQAKTLPRQVDVALVTARSELSAGSTKVGSIRFFPDGGATGGQITLTGGAQRYVVDVNWLTGRVAIYD